MKKLILPLLLALSMSGCSSLTPEQTDKLISAGTLLVVKVVDAKLAPKPVDAGK